MSFAGIDRELLSCASTVEAWAVLITTAVRMVPGAEYASITGFAQGRYQTHASSAQLANAVDAIPYRTGSGPCVEAVKTDTSVLVDDLGDDDRWPTFAQETVAKTPVRSLLSMSMTGDRDDVRFGLNLYAGQTGAFDEYGQAVATVLAGQTAIAIVATEARERAAQLETALANSRDIGIAMGVLMRSHSVTRDAAFDLLRTVSQRTHRKLADIARDVADTGTIDGL